MNETDLDMTDIRCVRCGGTIILYPGNITTPGATVPVSVAMDMMRACGYHVATVCTGKPA